MTNQAHNSNSTFPRFPSKSFHCRGIVVREKRVPLAIRELLLLDVPAASAISAKESPQFTGEAF